MVNKSNIFWRLGAIAVLAAVLLLAGPGVEKTVQAQENPNVNIDFFRPSVHPWDVLGIQTSAMPKAWTVTGGLWLVYTNDPLRLVDPVDDSRIYQIVANRFGGNLNLAIGLFNFLDLGIDIPMSYTTGEDPTKDPGTILKKAEGFHLGDIRVGLKGTIIGCNTGGFGLALSADVTFPTAMENAFVGDDGVTVTPNIIVDYRFTGGWLLAANLGYRFRPDTNLVGIKVTDDFLLGLGGVVPIIPETLEILGTAELRTDSAEFFGSKHHRAMDLHGAIRWRIGSLAITAGGGGGLMSGFGSPNFRALGAIQWMPPLENRCRTDRDRDGIWDDVDECPDQPGLGIFQGCPDSDNDGVEDRKDKCPTVPGLEAFDGCPDSDGDGIIDSEDKCPNKAGPKEWEGCPDSDGDGIPDHKDECPDKAGKAETNGCPDRDGDGIPDHKDDCPDVKGVPSANGCPDADGDGIQDSEDKCPNVKGTREYEGCPAPEKVMDEIHEIDEKVYFDYNSALINSDSMAVLERVARLMKENTGIKKLKIVGHASPVGPTNYNEKLSKRRAKAAYKALRKLGIDKSRLEYLGMGESKPVDAADEARRRKLSRRVEFEIVD